MTTEQMLKNLHKMAAHTALIQNQSRKIPKK